MTRYSMWVRCKFPMEAQQIGQKFQTMKCCPEGHPAGLEPIVLLEKCMECSKAVENRVTKRPPPMRMKKSPPPMRKK